MCREFLEDIGGHLPRFLSLAIPVVLTACAGSYMWLSVLWQISCLLREEIDKNVIDNVSLLCYHELRFENRCFRTIVLQRKVEGRMSCHQNLSLREKN